MKKAFLLMLTATCILYFVSFSPLSLDSQLPYSSKTSAKIFKIKVCKVVEHEAINSVVKGMVDYLKNSSSVKTEFFKKGQNRNQKYEISVETCQGNMALASQIIAKFAAARPDVVVTVGTIPSQAAYKFAKAGQIKMVFSSVTNPNDLSQNFQKCNIIGVSNFVPLAPQVNLFKNSA